MWANIERYQQQAYNERLQLLERCEMLESQIYANQVLLQDILNILGHWTERAQDGNTTAPAAAPQATPAHQDHFGNRRNNRQQQRRSSHNDVDSAKPTLSLHSTKRSTDEPELGKEPKDAL